MPVHHTSSVAVSVLDWKAAEKEAMRVREAVFVAEQGVPADVERDEWDRRSCHALATEPGGQIVGTGRLLPDGRIGRMAVLSEWRGRGIGGEILEALVARARERGLTRVTLHAQTHAASFYERKGFVATSEGFVEAGIPHVRMTRSL